jgi:WD40 repeat protein
VAVGSQPFAQPAVVLLDAETLEPLPDQLPGLPPRPARSPGVDFSADGRWLAAVFLHVARDADDPAVPITRQFARVWDLSDLDARPRHVELNLIDGGWHRVRLSEDGSVMYVGAPPAAYAVPGRPGGRTARPSWVRDDLMTSGGFPIDLSPDGRWLAVPVMDKATEDESLAVLDTRDGSGVADLAVGGAVFSPDGTRLASSSWDGVWVWEWPSGDLVRHLPMGVGLVPGLSPDGSMFYGAGYHGVESWDLRGTRHFVRHTPPASRQPLVLPQHHRARR